MRNKLNRLGAVLLSALMCFSNITLPVNAQDAGAEDPVPEQEPVTETAVPEEEPAETEEPEEVIEVTESEPEETAETEEQEAAPEEPAEVQEAEEEADSSLFADESWTLKVDLRSEDAVLEGYELETVYDGSEEYVILPGRPRRENYYFVGWALNPIEASTEYQETVYCDEEEVSVSELRQGGTGIVTIYAVWSEERWFQVNYHYNAENAKFSFDDYGNDVYTDRYKWIKTDEYYDLESPEAPGKVFLGWAYSADATEDAVITGKKIVEDYWDDAADGATVDLYGVWRESGKYVINYVTGDNAAFADGLTTKTKEMTEGPTADSGYLTEAVIYDKPVNADSSLVFKEWTVEKDGGVRNYKPGDSISKGDADTFGVNDGSVTTLTLTAVFEQGETYTATFHVGEGVTVNGSGVEEVSAGVYRSTFTQFDVSDRRSLPTEEEYGNKPLWTLEKAKHYAQGWYKNAELEGEPYYDLYDLFNGGTPTDVELWLEWEKMDYPVRYYPNLEGARPIGSTLSGSSYVLDYAEFDEEIVVYQGFIHPEYVLKGWNTDKAKAEAGVVQYRNGENIGKYFETADEALDLYGVWVKDANQKHVYYNPIYIGEVVDIDGQLSAAGWFTQVFQKSDAVIINQECIREGYVLKGWNTDEEKAMAGIVQYRNGENIGKYFAKGADDLILYAVWKDASVGGEVVYFPAIQGATREDGTQISGYECEKVEFRADEDVAINMTFNHPDYTLVGWATSEANAEKGIIAYSNGDELKKYFADHDDNLALYGVWKPDFGMIYYHPNRSGAAPVDRWLSQSGYQARSFHRGDKVIINQEMIHPSYILQGWATTKKRADSGKIDFRNGEDFEWEEFFGDKEEIQLYGVWKAGKGLITSVSVPEQTIYENWNANEESDSYSPDYSSYDLTPKSITVKAGGKTYKGTPEEVAYDIQDDTGEEISVAVRSQIASAENMPKTAKLKLDGIETSFKVKFVKDPVTVTIPEGVKIFSDDTDENGNYDFLPENMTVKVGKKTYTGDFETVAGKLESAQKMGARLSDWPSWGDGTQHAIELRTEKYQGRGRGYAMYPFTTSFVDSQIKSVEADDLRIMVDGEHSVYYVTNHEQITDSVTKDRLVEAVYMTVTLKSGERIEGQLADINKQLDERYGSHYRNVRLEGEGDSRTLVIGSCRAPFSIDNSEPPFELRKVAAGKSITLKADNEKKVTWVSYLTSVAKVSSKGKVTGVKEGVAPIGAKYTGGIQIFYVEVVPAVTTVDIRYRGSDENYHGSVSGRTLKLDEDTFKLETDVYPEKAIQDVTWTSSNKKIATIAEDGTVTRVKNGTVTFTAKATDGTGKKATVKVTFASFVEHLEITGPAEVAAGKKVTLKTLATRADGKTPTNKAVTWRSLDPSVVKITSKGVVTAVKGMEGQTVTIVATAKDRAGRRDEVIAEFPITVTAPVTAVKLKSPAGDYITGKTVTVSGSTYTITPEILGNPGNELKWTSAKKSVAEVDENGVVTKKKNGTVKITAAATDGTGKKAVVTLKFTD